LSLGVELEALPPPLQELVVNEGPANTVAQLVGDQVGDRPVEGFGGGVLEVGVAD
jgi:hypothetical protein